MKPTDFAVFLSRFLSSHLPSAKGCSDKTIDSYKQAFILFLTYTHKIIGIPPNKMQICNYTYENVIGFLDWLEIDRGNSTATRNQRMAPLKGFASFLLLEFPEHLAELSKILAIPVKKAGKSTVSYMKPAGIKLVLSLPDTNTVQGMRDKLALSLLYVAGLRVSELISIKVKDISLSQPMTILVHGKGSKTRLVPLVKESVPLIKKHLRLNRLDGNENGDRWLFENPRGNRLTRQSINYIVLKYSEAARKVDPFLVPADCSPHKFRHSIAMEMLENGVDLIYIKDFLGHESISTTEIYAKASSAKTTEAIVKAASNVIAPEKPVWVGNKGILEWLKGFSS